LPLLAKGLPPVRIFSIRAKTSSVLELDLLDFDVELLDTDDNDDVELEDDLVDEDLVDEVELDEDEDLCNNEKLKKPRLRYSELFRFKSV